MDKFPEKFNLLKLLQEESENQNSPIETIIKKKTFQKRNIIYLLMYSFICIFLSSGTLFEEW